jgi:hypothetical protein
MTTNQRPWSAPIRIDDVPETGLHLDLVADEGVRRAIAQLARLNALPRLEASFDLARRGDRLKIAGVVRATVGQSCVVTLDPVENVVEEAIDVMFAPPRGTDAMQTSEFVADVDAEEPPEALVEGRADLGALATDFLLLGIDPYPRKPGAVFTSRSGADEPKPGAFAALAGLKRGGS